MQTVHQARLKVLHGEKAAAEKLLVLADKECGASVKVLREISDLYHQMDNARMADIFRQQADMLETRSQTVILPSGEQKPPPKTEVASKYALVVGIGNFRSARISKLKYAAKDARDFAEVLKDPNAGRFPAENVTVLNDEQATLTGIRSALGEIAKRAKSADDLVLLYFSTHGSNPRMEDAKTASGYLITYDAGSNLYGTAFGMDELATFTSQKLRAERIIVILDTCYSGDTRRHMGSKALTVEETLPTAAIKKVAQGKGTVVITSSNGNELSWESDEQQNSFFTTYLMEALRDRKGMSNIEQIYKHLARRVPEAVRNYTKAKGLGDDGGATQTPTLYPETAKPKIIIGAPSASPKMEQP